MKLEVKIDVEQLGGSLEQITIRSLTIEGLTGRQNRLLLECLPREVECGLLAVAVGPPKERRKQERRNKEERRSGHSNRRKMQLVSTKFGFYTDRNGKSVADKRVSGQRRYIQDGYNGRRKYSHDRRKDETL